jgi:hypothetical protein
VFRPAEHCSAGGDNAAEHPQNIWVGY